MNQTKKTRTWSRKARWSKLTTKRCRWLRPTLIMKRSIGEKKRASRLMGLSKEAKRVQTKKR